MIDWVSDKVAAAVEADKRKPTFDILTIYRFLWEVSALQCIMVNPFSPPPVNGIRHWSAGIVSDRKEPTGK